jgi:hypothetical protein
MSHPFRTRLVLEQVESRIALSQTPIDPRSLSDPALTSTEAEAAPYVSIDFAHMATGGVVNECDQIAITVYLDNGTVASTFVNFTQPRGGL